MRKIRESSESTLLSRTSELYKERECFRKEKYLIWKDKKKGPIFGRNRRNGKIKIQIKSIDDDGT